MRITLAHGLFIIVSCFSLAVLKVLSGYNFKTTPCPLKRQRENHTGVIASDSSHEYTVDRRSIS